MENKCRSCLTESHKLPYYSLLTVFPEFARKSLSVWDLLSTVTSSEVVLSDDLPSKICFECFKSLKSAYSFIIAFQHSQKILIESIQQTKETNELAPGQSNENQQENQKLGCNEEEIIIIAEQTENNCLAKEASDRDYIDISINKDETEHNEPEKFISDVESIDPSDNDLQEEADTFDDDGLEEKMYIMDVSGHGDKIKEEDINIINIEKCYLNLNNKIDQDIVELTEVIVEDNKSKLKKSLSKIEPSKHFKCEFCENLYTARKYVLVHVRNKHPEKLNEYQAKLKRCRVKGDLEIYKCDVCDKVFNNRYRMQNHNVIFHHPEWNKIYRCDICNEVFKNKNAASYHKLAKHQGKNFTCNVCQKKFINQSTLRQHVISVHEKNRPENYLCSICGRGFKYPTALKYHMGKEHTNKRDFVCGYCGVTFILVGELRSHERIHTGERPFSCKYCKKTFRRSSERYKHERMHQGIFPHKCEYCGGDKRKFSSMYNMKVHWLQHRGDFECVMCHKGYASAEILKFHYMNKHKVKDVVIEEEN